MPLPSQGLRWQSYSTRWSRFCNTVWESFFLSSSLTACLRHPRYSASLHHLTQWEHRHPCPQLPWSSFRDEQNRNKMPGLRIFGQNPCCHTSSLPWPQRSHLINPNHLHIFSALWTHKTPAESRRNLSLLSINFHPNPSGPSEDVNYWKSLLLIRKSCPRMNKIPRAFIMPLVTGSIRNAPVWPSPAPTVG